VLGDAKPSSEVARLTVFSLAVVGEIWFNALVGTARAVVKIISNCNFISPPTMAINLTVTVTLRTFKTAVPVG
jgi:hypothetical protein